MILVSCSQYSDMCVCDTGVTQLVLGCVCVCDTGVIQLVLRVYVCVRYWCHIAGAQGVCVCDTGVTQLVLRVCECV